MAKTIESFKRNIEWKFNIILSGLIVKKITAEDVYEAERDMQYLFDSTMSSWIRDGMSFSEFSEFEDTTISTGIIGKNIVVFLSTYQMDSNNPCLICKKTISLTYPCSFPAVPLTVIEEQMRYL